MEHSSDDFDQTIFLIQLYTQPDISIILPSHIWYRAVNATITGVQCSSAKPRHAADAS